MRITSKPEKRELVFRFGPDEDDLFERLLKYGQQFENVEVQEVKKTKYSDIPVVARGGGTLPPKTDYKRKAEVDPRIFETWKLWFYMLKTKCGIVDVPQSPSGEDLGHIKTLIKEYGDRVTEIFKLAMMDWAAFATKMKIKSDAPNLKVLVAYRRDFAAALSLGGFTTSKQRVSDYGKESGKAASDWES